jgi:hypothetical protein
MPPFVISEEEWKSIFDTLPSAAQEEARKRVRDLMTNVVNSVTTRVQLTATTARDNFEEIERNTTSLLNALATEGADLSSPGPLHSSWDNAALTPLGHYAAEAVPESRLAEVVAGLVRLRDCANHLVTELRDGGRELVRPVLNVRRNLLAEACDTYRLLAGESPSTAPQGGFFMFCEALWAPGYRLAVTLSPELSSQLPATITRDAINSAVTDWRKSQRSNPPKI